MKSIVDKSNNIILIAENAQEQNLLNNIPDIGILYKGPTQNPQTRKTDFVLTLQPGERVVEKVEIQTAFSPIEIVDETVIEKLERILTLLEEHVQEQNKTREEVLAIYIESLKSPKTENNKLITDKSKNKSYFKDDLDTVIKG